MIYAVYTSQRSTLETAYEDALERAKAWLPEDTMLATKTLHSTQLSTPESSLWQEMGRKNKDEMADSITHNLTLVITASLCLRKP